MSGSLLVAIGLSLLSAVAYALAAVAQERLAAAPKPASLVTSRRWWSSNGLNGGGAVLHTFALGFGSLTVVQPLGTLTLVVALPVGAAIAGRRVLGREWRGALTTVAGLVILLLAADTGAPTEALTNDRILGLVAVTVVAIGALAGGGTARMAGLRLAGASGIGFAVSSVLTQTVLLRMQADGAGALLDPVLAGALVAVAALAVGALLLSQAAYKYGLGAPLATLTLTNPIVAAAGGLMAAAGVVQLSRPSERPSDKRAPCLVPPRRTASIVEHSGTLGARRYARPARKP
jgi:hypothetical protein